MKLVIVESPTKAKTISQFLGKGFTILSSMGHVRDLPKSKLGVDVENNFEPHYIIPIKAKKNLTALKKQAAKADEVILATDEDREGEAIAWHLAQALDIDPAHAKRIVFHEITKKAIEEAIQHPRGLYLHLVDAQQARRILDRLVGYNLSPFLWKKVARGLSAGRVQSVAVRLICEREAEREAFKPQEYWTIEADFATAPPKGGTVANFQTQLVATDGRTLEKFDITNTNDAQKIADDIKNGNALVTAVETKEEKKNPLAPFTTSTLQQAGAQRLYFSAKQTMALAQRLYEKGFITYMRTDSLNLSADALEQAAEFIKNELGNDYTLPAPRTFKTKSKGAQEAHEAIRPTDVTKTPELLQELFEEDREWKLYNLIWRRFLASQLPAATIEQSKIDVCAKTKEHEYLLRANGSRLVFDGFLKIYPMKFSENILPKLNADDAVIAESVIPLQHFTEPPPRFNEASIIKALEKYGIGRPSTYAPTISTIQDRGYVEKDEQRRLYPTETGKIVNGILVEHFPKIVDIEFTAHMEQDLDEIAEGTKAWVPLIREFYDPFSKTLAEKYESVATQKVEEKTDKICPKCGKPMVIKRGRFGKFIACSGFPECKTTERIPEPALKDMKCPKCTEGNVIRRKSKRGRFFFGCSRWPECDFVSWTLPARTTDDVQSGGPKKEGEEPEKPPKV